MDEKAKILSDIMTWLTYFSSFLTIVMNFLNTYSLAFGVIFAGITCWINWRVQRLRVQLMLRRKDDNL